ncbi:hypothetical protein ACFC1T_08810 [Kitasatospora sp. NPDC056076]|uniref:hypothetical protein n=1 Tax=Kitasatospora sp. NPDC056076 TaxID=3345703 RepID=UPI0035DE77B5
MSTQTSGPTGPDLTPELLEANRARHRADMAATAAAHAEWARTHRLVANCRDCDRVTAVHVPRGGDGTVVITAWHKRPTEDGHREWCRTEIDSDDTRWELRDA